MSETNLLFMIVLFLVILLVGLYVFFSLHSYNNGKQVSLSRYIKYALQTCSINKPNELLTEIFRERNVKIYTRDDVRNRKIELESSILLPCGYTYLEKELDSLKTTPLSNVALIFGIDGCDTLVSKNLLWQILKENYSEEVVRQWIPKTYLFSKPSDIQELMAIYEYPWQHQFPIIIFKKNIQRKEGLLLTKSPEEVLNVIKNNQGDPTGYVVAQEFIPNSLRVYGHKLNMRIYLLAVRFAHTTETHFYLHSHVKCIYANIASKGVHDMRLEANITSLNLNKDYIYNKRKFPIDKNDLAKYLEKETVYRYEKDIWFPLIKAMRQTTLPFRTLLGKNKHYLKTTRFQLFGGDIIFEEESLASRHSNQLKPLLLEFNKGPDMSFSNDQEKGLKKQVLQDTFDIASGIENKNFLLLL